MKLLGLALLFVGFNANAFTRVYSCDSVNQINNQRVYGFSNSVEIEISDHSKDTPYSLGSRANVYKNIRPGNKKKLKHELLLTQIKAGKITYKSDDQSVSFVIDAEGDADVGTLSFGETQSFLCTRE